MISNINVSIPKSIHSHSKDNSYGTHIIVLNVSSITGIYGELIKHVLHLATGYGIANIKKIFELGLTKKDLRFR